MAYCRAGLQQLERVVSFAEALDPWFSLALFLVCSMLMVYRLNVLERKGLEGTVLGTLVMPYASGFPNLMFAFSLGRQGGSGSVIVENCIVNNVTNLTLLIGLPALIWTLNIIPSRSAQAGSQARVQAPTPEHPVLDPDPRGPLFFHRRPVGIGA
jgi:Ca2+/Na+ antiporter